VKLVILFFGTLIKKVFTMKAILGLASLILIVNTGFAQVLKNPSMQEMVDSLDPQTPIKSNGHTRGLSRNLEVTPKSIDLSIQFEFDSAELQEVSKTVLSDLAVAMNNPRLINVSFRVEGHTDAVGSADYNFDLSKRRADTVANFLSNQGVNIGRLTSFGLGFSDLLNKQNPKATENRRVRIVAKN
jgi:outer membrane protein OmpA-like peptidoglycan-associated protein